MDNEIVYIILNNKKSISTNQDIYIKDIAKVSTSNLKTKKKLEDLKIYKGKRDEDWDYISSDMITQRISERYKDIDIKMLGACETLLEIKSLEGKSGIGQFLKVLVICIVVFIGSGIAIINFHEDVNMVKSIEKIYYTVTGNKKDKPLIITVPYSIGLGVGVITFFTRIISKSERRRKEPGPMETELYLYNKDMEEYILNELLEREDKEQS